MQIETYDIIMLAILVAATAFRRLEGLGLAGGESGRDYC